MLFKMFTWKKSRKPLSWSDHHSPTTDPTTPLHLPGCLLPHRGSWAGKPSRAHRCHLPGHSLSEPQTAESWISHQGQEAGQWPGPDWGDKTEWRHSARLSVTGERCLLGVWWDSWGNQAQHTVRAGSQTSAAQTHMLTFRSQISSCFSLTAPNTVAHLGDHLTSITAACVELKPSTGLRWSCFHSWRVQSEEPLRNTSGLRGHHEMQFTGHYEGEKSYLTHTNHISANRLSKSISG